MRRQPKVPFMIYIHPKLYNAIRSSAKSIGMSMSSLANILLYKAMRDLKIISETRELERKLKEIKSIIYEVRRKVNEESA